MIVAVGAFAGYLAFDSYARRRSQSEALSERAGGYSNFTEAGDDSLISMDQTKTPLAIMLEPFARIVAPNFSSTIEKLSTKLKHAGINSVSAPIYYLVFQRIVGPILAILGFILIRQRAEGLDFALNVILGGTLMVIGVFGAHLYVTNKRQNRQKILTRSFPDALDLLLVCVESGLALDAALARVTKELGRAHPMITAELNRTRLELALLNDREQALTNLAERTNLIPFRSLVAALLQTEKFGTSLTDTLRVLSDDYRQSRLLAAETKAGRLPALITIPLILLLMPAFALIVMGPALIRVFQQGGIFGDE